MQHEHIFYPINLLLNIPLSKCASGLVVLNLLENYFLGCYQDLLANFGFLNNLVDIPNKLASHHDDIMPVTV